MSGQRTLTYFACAKNHEGKIGQLRVTRVMGPNRERISSTQEWTGVVYKSMRAAEADLGRLNDSAVIVSA